MNLIYNTCSKITLLEALPHIEDYTFRSITTYPGGGGGLCMCQSVLFDALRMEFSLNYDVFPIHVIPPY